MFQRRKELDGLYFDNTPTKVAGFVKYVGQSLREGYAERMMKIQYPLASPEFMQLRAEALTASMTFEVTDYQAYRDIDNAYQTYAAKNVFPACDRLDTLRILHNDELVEGTVYDHEYSVTLWFERNTAGFWIGSRWFVLECDDHIAKFVDRARLDSDIAAGRVAEPYQTSTVLHEGERYPLHFVSDVTNAIRYITTTPEGKKSDFMTVMEHRNKYQGSTKPYKEPRREAQEVDGVKHITESAVYDLAQAHSSGRSGENWTRVTRNGVACGAFDIPSMSGRRVYFRPCDQGDAIRHIESLSPDAGLYLCYALQCLENAYKATGEYVAWVSIPSLARYMVGSDALYEAMPWARREEENAKAYRILQQISDTYVEVAKIKTEAKNKETKYGQYNAQIFTMPADISSDEHHLVRIEATRECVNWLDKSKQGGAPAYLPGSERIPQVTQGVRSAGRSRDAGSASYARAMLQVLARRWRTNTAETLKGSLSTKRHGLIYTIRPEPDPTEARKKGAKRLLGYYYTALGILVQQGEVKPVGDAAVFETVNTKTTAKQIEQLAQEAIVADISRLSKVDRYWVDMWLDETVKVLPGNTETLDAIKAIDTKRRVKGNREGAVNPPITDAISVSYQ